MADISKLIYGMCGKIKVFEIKKELWKQIVDIPGTMSTDSQKICFVLKDEDVGKDDIVAILN